jgi:ceramide synthetase
LQPWGHRVFDALVKKNDLKWSKEDYGNMMRKWTESCWKLVVYTVFTLLAFAATYSEPYFWDPKEYWTGATAFPLNYYVPRKTILFYIVEVGFYIQAIPFLCFIEVRRKDWLESFAHHWITLGLMGYSYYANFTRPGIMVMLIHDVSDIFLEAAKLARYADKQKAATNLFASFALSWIICRCIIYPYLFIHRFLVDPIVMIAIPYNIYPQPHYAFFGSMFMALYFLHLYWTYLIIMVIVRQMKTGTPDDVREDD